MILEQTLMAEIWHIFVRELILLQPFIPTYIHLLVSALIPIIAGAHASLSRPTSAAAPLDESDKSKLNEADDEDDHESADAAHHMEGLAPSDAIAYPILIGCMLSGLYFLLKWLEDPTILNRILNLYLSAFGIPSMAGLVTDSVNVCLSFIFPRVYFDQGIEWVVKNSQGCVSPKRSVASQPAIQIERSSPLPGIFSRVAFPNKVSRYLWASRRLAMRPVCSIQIYVRGTTEAKLSVRLQDVLGLCSSLVAVLYFNFVDKPWWLTNILGFGFCYNALQIISPSTFWTGTLILVTLFAYDVYFVFFTPMMITVATSLDIPVKLLFPRPSDDNGSPPKQQLAMLGLGDIVLPGIVIGLALRFDLYLFYLKQQIRTKSSQVNLFGGVKVDASTSSSDKHIRGDVVGPTYRVATGYWGERFWLGPGRDERADGGRFPKTYFYAGLIGYVSGMLCTLTIMHIFKHGQPALLYLVPSVLAAIWGTAFIRGENKHLWEYTEAGDEASKPIRYGLGSIKNSTTNAATGTSTSPELGPSTRTSNLDDARTESCLAYIIVKTVGSVNTTR